MITPTELDEMEAYCVRVSPWEIIVEEYDGLRHFVPAQTVPISTLDLVKRARTDLPRAIAEIRRLRKALEKLATEAECNADDATVLAVRDTLGEP